MTFANCARLLSGNVPPLRFDSHYEVLSLNCTVDEFFSPLMVVNVVYFDLKLCMIVV